MKQERKVTEEESGEVVLGRLATAGVPSKDVDWPDVRVVDLCDLLG